VKQFIEENPLPFRKAVLSELRQIDDQFSGQALENVIYQLGCYYLPTKDRGMETEVCRPELRHAGPKGVNREAELDRPSSVACSDLLGSVVMGMLAA